MKPIIRVAMIGLLGYLMFAGPLSRNVELSAIIWGDFTVASDSSPQAAALTWGS
jgi:hypothetical protein